MRRHLVGRSTIGAIATLTTERPRGHGLFTFGDDGLPAVFSAERHHDLGNGESLLMTFTGRPSDFRDIDGLRT